MTCVVKTRFGENAADRGSGFGPWTVQASFKADEGGIRDLGLERAAAREAEGSNSRYEEPEAEGMRPVLRTKAESVRPCHCQRAFNCIDSYRFSSARSVVVGAERGL